VKNFYIFQFSSLLNSSRRGLFRRSYIRNLFRKKLAIKFLILKIRGCKLRGEGFLALAMFFLKGTIIPRSRSETVRSGNNVWTDILQGCADFGEESSTGTRL